MDRYFARRYLNWVGVGFIAAAAAAAGIVAAVRARRAAIEAAAASQHIPRAPRSTAASSSAGSKDCDGRVVLVTGASSGIGRECALCFARAGARVAVHFNANLAGAEETVAACEAVGATAVAFQADLSDESGGQAEKLLAAVAAHFGRVHVLVNNTGIFERLSVDQGDTDFAAFRDVWRRTISTNLTSAAYLSFLTARHMMAAQPSTDSAAVDASSTIGAIVCVSSRGAFRGEPAAWAYGASKGGMNSLVGSMAQALGRHGIVVNAVAPGFVDTDRVAGVLAGAAGAAVAAQSPMNRVATPQEVADCVLFLARYWVNPWTTGAILDCNGASYLRS